MILLYKNLLELIIYSIKLLGLFHDQHLLEHVNTRAYRVIALLCPTGEQSKGVYME